ncbi:MAG: transposase [Bacteroidota bacterium]
MPDYHSNFEYDKYYHIFNRGNNKEDLFKSANNYRYFLQKWKKYISPYSSTLAYCLMPNHFHFLVHIPHYLNLNKPIRLSKGYNDLDINEALEEQFRKLFMSYALAFNKQQNRSGSLFQKGFKRIEIDLDEYLTRLIQYIHNNPIHHGFVKNYRDWHYSSYNAIVSSSQTYLDREAVLNWFGGKNALIEFHKEQIEIRSIQSYLIE